MKKTKLFFSFLGIILLLNFFTSCLKNNQQKRKIVSGKIGIYDTIFFPGDIVFTDGSAISYKKNLQLTEVQKNNVVAFIYKCDFVKDSDNKTHSRILGVGFIHNKDGISWCSGDSKSLRKNIKAVQCNVSGTKGNLEFTGDTNGSDNIFQISEYLVSCNAEDDTKIQNHYPAFYYAINYKNILGSNVLGTQYEDGWFLPSAYELFCIFEYKNAIEEISKQCEKSLFEDGFYWSSSQCPGYDTTGGISIDFENGDWHGYNKGSRYIPGYENRSYFSCAIREF